jgi:LPXTG-motif cell wall-anchored protein
MKKLAVLCVAALGAALLVLGTAPAASAYPELTCSVSVDRQVVSSGERFTATGTVSGVDAQNDTLPSSAYAWTFRWNGETKHRTGAVVTASFTAPKVRHARTIRLTARTTSAAGDCVRHLDITVRSTSVSAPGGGGSGGMPNTGGPAFWMLVAGLVLVVGGGGVVVGSRRRRG